LQRFVALKEMGLVSRCCLQLAQLAPPEAELPSRRLELLVQLVALA
jgi:hypothetical protein